MKTTWQTEDYEVPARWWGTKKRSRVLNADGKVMLNDLDRDVAAAIVAEHNYVIAALRDEFDRPESNSETPRGPDPSPDPLSY